MPTVSELKERARGFEQKGELATALKVYRHILAHLEGTQALAAELPLYVKIGDLSAKLGSGTDAVEMYRKAGEQYALAGSSKTLVALALKVIRVDPARTGVYGQFAADLLSRGHDRPAAEVMSAAAERGGMGRLRAALAWAMERSDDDARGVLVRLAEALAQSNEAAEREAGAITAAPAPSSVATEMPPPPPPPAPPPPDDEPLEFERISEAETPSGARTVWAADEPELSNLPEDEPAPAVGGDLGLVTDRWKEALEQVTPPPARPPEPPPWPDVPTIEPARASSPAQPPPLPPAPPPREGTLEFSPLVEASAPAPPAEAAQPERTSARRSAPFGRVLVEESRRKKGSKVPLIAAGLVLVVGGGVAAVVFDLIPTGGGRPVATANPTPGPSTPEFVPPSQPVADSVRDTMPPPASDTARAPQPVAPPADTIRPVDTVATRIDPPARDTALPPPATVIPPVNVTVTVPVPTPVAPPDTATGPPTVRVPPGTSLRDLLIVVPGMPVDSVVVVPVAGRRGHRVVQRFPNGEPLMLASVPMTGSDTVGISDARITVVGDTTVGSVRFWNFLVTARARADADTLARMLRRLVRARPVR